MIHEIVGALKEEKLLDPDEEFESVDHILNGLEKSSARVAAAVNTPPLDVAALRQEWTKIRDEVKAIPPPNRPSTERLWNQWKDMRSVAAQQGLSVFQLFFGDGDVSDGEAAGVTPLAFAQRPAGRAADRRGFRGAAAGSL